MAAIIITTLITTASRLRATQTTLSIITTSLGNKNQKALREDTY